MSFFDAVGDAVSGVGDFFMGSGGGSTASAGFFTSAANFAGDAFGWINDNPEAANALGGVAMGLGSAYTAQQDREQRARDNRLDRELQRELQSQRIEAEQIAPGQMSGNYNSYGDGVTRGLISEGMLASTADASING